MTDLQHLADALATDYLHVRWQPKPTEEHRTRILAAGASVDGGLDRLGDGRVITVAAITQMLRPAPTEPDAQQWRIAEPARLPGRRSPRTGPHPEPVENLFEGRAA